MFGSFFRGVLFILLTIGLSGGAILGQSSGFTYQGRLTDGGTPANGNYDLQVALFDSADGVTQIGQTQTVSNVPVTGGVFTVTLDFGASAFNGAARFLEISTRRSGAGAFTLLTPRQPISSTPYALHSVNADNAVNAQQLNGVAAAQYVKTDDARLTDPRDPKTGSSNYVQNTSSQQAGANFNISGNGTAGGALSGNTVNAGTQYNLAGQKALSMVSPNLLKLSDAANVGIGPTWAPDYKLDVETADKNGLRVGTATAGGTALSIGGAGSVQVDAPGQIGARFTIQENGNVGIGTANPGSKLQVVGTVESNSGGFKFPDGSIQASAVNPAIGKVWAFSSNTEMEIGKNNSAIPLVSVSLPPPTGYYLITATVYFENRANDFLADNSRHVRCFLSNDFSMSHMGAPGNPMDSMVVTVHILFLQQPGQNPQVSFSCGTTESGGQVFAKVRRITAVRVADNPQ